MEISEKKLPLGLHEESTESLSAKKSYASPTVKVVDFVVEKGFTASPGESENRMGSTFYLSDMRTLNQTGTAANEWQTVGQNDWFYTND